MVFDASYFAELFFDRRPDLFFRVFDEDRLILDSRSSMTLKLEPGEHSVMLEVPAGATEPEPEPEPEPEQARDPAATSPPRPSSRPAAKPSPFSLQVTPDGAGELSEPPGLQPPNGKQDDPHRPEPIHRIERAPVCRRRSDEDSGGRLPRARHAIITPVEDKAPIAVLPCTQPGPRIPPADQGRPDRIAGSQLMQGNAGGA
jgi:hypothetical protein